MRRQFVVPDDLLQRLQADADQLGVNISAALVLKLSQAYGLQVDPPKHGGRRVPHDLVGCASITNTPAQPRLGTTARQIQTLQPHLRLKDQGYPYAEMANGRYTGKLLPNKAGDCSFVGEMTLVEFQRRAGLRAFVD